MGLAFQLLLKHFGRNTIVRLRIQNSFLGLLKFQHCLFDPTEREPRDTQIGPINSFICNNYRDIYWFVRENLKIDDEFEVNACSILNYDSLFPTTFKICSRVCTHCFGMNWILSLFKAQNLSNHIWSFLIFACSEFKCIWYLS